MQDLSAADQDRLGPFTRTIYHAIKSELKVHEAQSVDASRTRFWIRHDPHPDWGDCMHCEVMRTDPSSLDFGLGVYDDPHLFVALGLLGEDWDWEKLDLDNFANQDELIERLIGLLQDWLGGRVKVITTYAGRVPCHWIVRRGDEILAEGRRFIYPYFAKKRTVVRHS